jgi:hypothetical protein
MRQILSAVLLCGLSMFVNQTVKAQPDSNSAMNAPDQFAWETFMQVNAPAGGTNALFETWASDTDTFNMTPNFPTAPTPLVLHAPVVATAGRQALQRAGHLLPALPPGILQGVSEEARRNQAAFEFIKSHNLNKVSGLRTAFGTTISFPTDAIEVKGNWIPIASVPAWSNNRVSVADAPKFFHINSAKDGSKYALVALHVITKQVPNWTWATFESEFNPARCDIIGCNDTFGAPKPVPSNKTFGQGYPACVATPALAALFAKANLEAAFTHYCLKGSQTDFTDNSGLDVRLGNSVTEDGFVDQSSCMTCHGRAAFDKTGHDNPAGAAGFDSHGAPLGPTSPAVYWKYTGKPPQPFYSNVVGAPGLTRIMTSVDFVWSIAFCAANDTVTPVKLRCQGK